MEVAAVRRRERAAYATPAAAKHAGEAVCWRIVVEQIVIAGVEDDAEYASAVIGRAAPPAFCRPGRRRTRRHACVGAGKAVAFKSPACRAHLVELRDTPHEPVIRRPTHTIVV